MCCVKGGSRKDADGKAWGGFEEKKPPDNAEFGFQVVSWCQWAGSVKEG